MNLEVDFADEVKLELSSITDIFEKHTIKVCFVCTGNTCRSPMAAAVLNKLGKEYGIIPECRRSDIGLCGGSVEEQ